MPNNIITKEWMDANDAAIQKKLQPLKDVKVVRVLSEAPQSWESLLTYTISNNTYSFKPGDEVRVPDNDATTGYTYYKLHKIENNTATWEALGESSAPQMCSITVIITSDGNTEPEGMSFSVTDNQGNVFGTGLSGETVMVPIGTNYIVSGSEVEGYQVESVQGTASENSVNVTLAYIKYIPNGVYAYYSDGSLRDLEHADTNAIGVAVIDDVCSFVIDKIDSGGYILPSGQDLVNCGIYTSSYTSPENSDFQGYHNTTILKGYVDNYTGIDPSNYAANRCRARFNNKGYLPALSELYTAYLLKEEVNAMIGAIGGTVFTNGKYLTSTLYSASSDDTYFWSLKWQDGSTESLSTMAMINSRAFSTIPLSVTLTLSSSDGTSIANREILIVDKTEEPKIVTSDSTGRVTATVAMGDIDIRVKGCHTLTKHIVLNSNTRNITVEIRTPDPGIYAYYADGTMRDYDNADSTAVGVAVVTSNCSFVMAKDSTNLSSSHFGGYKKDLSDTAMTTTDATIAKTDFNGESNTINIFNACAGYTYNNITGSPVTYRCRDRQYSYEGVRGYVGSLGEWYTAYQNKSSIDSMFEKIGGGLDSSPSFYFWTSTHGNTLDYTWVLYWSTGSTIYKNRDQNGLACAFCAL